MEASQNTCTCCSGCHKGNIFLLYLEDFLTVLVAKALNLQSVNNVSSWILQNHIVTFSAMIVTVNLCSDAMQQISHQQCHLNIRYMNSF